MSRPTIPPPVPDRGGTGPARTRRQLLGHGAAAALAGALAPPGGAWAQNAPVADPSAKADGGTDLPAAGSAFTPDTVTNLARALAARPHEAPRTDDLPEVLTKLGREHYAGLRTAPGSAVWAGDALGVTLEPLHRGSVYTDRVAIAVVENGIVRPIPYDPARFAADGPALPALPDDTGYSGLRLRASFGGDDLAEFAVFQGASFFRLAAAGQQLGVTARALTLRPADPRGEEFPRFRALWVERPVPGGAIVLHALVDSASATAALAMTLRPGPVSVAEITGTVFARAALDHVGLAGMTTRYLFGPTDRRAADDVRAGAHASDGLRIRTGAGEAIWRPLRNPDTLQVSSFLDDNPKGFGLMQRMRDHGLFQDDQNAWETRPSLWVEPGGNWGPGSVCLLEIPSDSDANENVLAYWRPKEGVAAGGSLALAYRQSWGWDAPERLRLAAVTGTRSGRGTAEGRRLFAVDFSGDDLSAGPDLQTVLTASPGTVLGRRLHRYPERRTVRVVFELDPGGEKACELRLVLRRDDRPVTETWLYRWTP